jgi:hypothetical protein
MFIEHSVVFLTKDKYNKIVKVNRYQTISEIHRQIDKNCRVDFLSIIENCYSSKFKIVFYKISNAYNQFN